MDKKVDKHKEILDVPKQSSSLDIPQFTEEKVGVSVGTSQNRDFLKRKGKQRCISGGGGGGKTSLRQSSGKNKREDPSLSNLQNVLKKRRKDCKISKLTSNGVVLATEKSCYLNDDDTTGDFHEPNHLNNIQQTSSDAIISCGKCNIDKFVDSTGNDQHCACLDSNIVIPKRPRGVSHRKQSFEPVIPTTIVDGLSSSNHKNNSNAYSSMLSGDLVTTSNVKTKKTLNQQKENGSNSGRREVLVEVVPQNDKEENVIFSATQTKVIREHKRRRYHSSETHADVENVGIFSKKNNESVSDSQEENLDEYAARTFYSPFNPNCTRFSGSTSPEKQANGFSIDSNGLGSKHSSGHDASRVLRPRSRNAKNGVRKRRHFYEVCASDIDPFWIVMRNIKVFWPLDKNWYFGLVKDYNASAGLHHVKYDDHEEEWIDLENERFKLLMFPKEFTCKDFRKRDNDVQKETEEGEDAIVGNCFRGMKDSEPIISWLARSFDRVKPSPKEKKRSRSSKQSSLHFAQREDHTVACSSGINSDKDIGFIASHMVVNDISHIPVFKNEEGTIDRRYSLFYCRRRFHKRRKIIGTDFGEDLAYRDLIFKYAFQGALEFNTTSKTLKLNQGTPVVMLSLQHTHNLTFSSEAIWLLSNFWWFHFGKLMAMWPEIYLEIFFLDNVKGLKVISFEGCLRNAVVLLCLILKIFQHSNVCWKPIQDQCPFTSIGFRFSVIQDIGRQLHFATHYFLELESSKWGYLHQSLKNRCFLMQEIPVSECTYSSTKNLLERRFMVPLPEVLGRHLNFLMPSYSFQNKNVSSSNYLQDNHDRDISSADKFDERSHSFLDTINYQKQQHDQVEGQQLDAEVKEETTIDMTRKMNDSTVHGMIPTFRSGGQNNMHNTILTSFGFNPQAFSNNNDFVNDNRNPRTRVYSSSHFRGFHSGRESQSRRQKSRHPRKKTKTNTAKNFKPVSKNSQKNVSSLICEANVLVTEGDIGWREHAAKVLLDFDDQEWKILIKVSGVLKYSHRARQFLQPGATNRHTHAMLWKGGKNWTLEFTDRGQWTLFKEMHQECYNQNIRAAYVKNIPIPGVRLIEENNDHALAVPFTHCFPNYISQTGTEVDVAMDPSRSIYDMDSDDEEWVSKQENSMDDGADKMTKISCKMFEDTIEILEKYAYAEQCDEFLDDEIMCFMEKIGPPEAIKSIHEYWFSKRQKKGMALIWQFQPPLWEQYQKQLQEWELAESANAISSNGQGKGTPIEKPPMFAFCLKPPIKGSKQRPHKKLTGSGSHSMILREKHNLQGTGRASIMDLDHESSDSSHSLQSPTRISPIDDTSCTTKSSMSNSWLESKKLQRGNNKKTCLFSSVQKTRLYNQKVKGTKITQQKSGSPKFLNTGKIKPGLWRHRADIEEFRLRDLSNAAQHASNMAKLKREKLKWSTHKADLAVNRAAIALMIVEAMKASTWT